MGSSYPTTYSRLGIRRKKKKHSWWFVFARKGKWLRVSDLRAEAFLVNYDTYLLAVSGMPINSFEAKRSGNEKGIALDKKTKLRFVTSIVTSSKRKELITIGMIPTYVSPSYTKFRLHKWGKTLTYQLRVVRETHPLKARKKKS